jgi:tetratricopeptide (TPR) repeat protein
MVLALLAGCESTARTPGELIRQQAEQEAQAAPATPVALPPPEFLMPRAASDPALAERTLEEAEQRIAPARPGETAQPVTEDADAEWLAKVRAHASQREFDQAVQLMLAEARRDPARPQLWRELARLFDGLGRRDTALNAWSQLRSLAPMDLEAIASSGLDCLALRKFLPAAEHLLLARRLLLTAPPDEARQRMQVACAAGLGLALGELGYAMAAAACFHDAAQLERALLQSPSADERSLPRQGREFERFAGEMEASAGHWSEASRSFAEALSRSEATSAVALPPLVWSLACSGRPAEARRCVMEALAQPDRPGRAGAPAAVQWLQRHGLASPLEVALTERAGADASTQDALVLRCLVALGREEAAQRVVDLESDARICGDEIALGEAARLLAAKRGDGGDRCAGRAATGRAVGGRAAQPAGAGRGGARRDPADAGPRRDARRARSELRPGRL